MYNIYVHTLPDGRKYVGSTKKQNPKKRWKGAQGYRKHKTLFNAIKSVGWNNIQHEILETVEDKETAFKREEYYTLLWRTNEPEFGFNVAIGKKHNEETKKRICEIHKGHPAWNKGIPQTEEAKRKNSESNKGHKRQPFSKEHCEKIGAALKGHVSAIKGTKLVMVNGKRTYVKKTEE